MGNGNQNISNTNISYNNVIYISGIVSYHPNIMFSHSCTFYNNTVSSEICIYLLGSISNIFRSNFILNNSPSNGVLFFTNSCIYYIFECIFNENKNILFYVDLGNVELINCFINHQSSSITTDTKTQPIFIPTLIITKAIVYEHSIYSTFYCSYSLNIYENTQISTRRNERNIFLYILDIWIFFYLLNNV